MNINSKLIKTNAAMEAVFLSRSELHRKLVRENLLLMQGYLKLPLTQLTKVAKQHDQSKFVEPERTAYIWMTWKYYCEAKGIFFEYPEAVAPLVLQGWQQHIHTNSHHPEAHDDPDAINELDIVEMVCDWTAISQEQNFNNASCLQWANDNIDKKWRFSAEKKHFILATIHELDARRRSKK